MWAAPPLNVPPFTGSVPPPKSITSWFTSKGLGKTLDEVTVSIPHDIYVFGTQENSTGDKEWVDFLRAVLKDFTEIEYRPVGAPFSPPHPPPGSRGYPGCAGTGCFGVGARGAGVLGDVVVPGAVAIPCHCSFATWQEPTFGVQGAAEGAAGSVGAARSGCVGARCAPRLGHGSGRGVPLRGVSSVGSHGPRPPRWPCSPCGTSKWWCW